MNSNLNKAKPKEAEKPAKAKLKEEDKPAQMTEDEKK